MLTPEKFYILDFIELILKHDAEVNKNVNSPLPSGIFLALSAHGGRQYGVKHGKPGFESRRDR